MNEQMIKDAAKKAADKEHLRRLYEACGRIMWLWSNSDLHKTWPVALQTRFVLPAVLHGNFFILERDGTPCAYCSWAWLTLEAEAKFVLNPNSLEPEDWIGGDRLWFVDWIGPFAARDTRELRSLMAAKFPRELARAYRVKPGQKEARIATFAGGDLSREEAKAIRARLYTELTERLATHPEKGQGFRLRQSVQ